MQENKTALTAYGDYAMMQCSFSGHKPNLGPSSRFNDPSRMEEKESDLLLNILLFTRCTSDSAYLCYSRIHTSSDLRPSCSRGKSADVDKKPGVPEVAFLAVATEAPFKDAASDR
jgi:hypothetical protein